MSYNVTCIACGKSETIQTLSDFQEELTQQYSTLDDEPICLSCQIRLKHLLRTHVVDLTK